MTILISAHPHKHLHQSNMALNVLLWPASADDAICTIPYSRKISIVIFVDVTEFFHVFIFEDHTALHMRTHAQCFLCGKERFFRGHTKNCNPYNTITHLHSIKYSYSMSKI